MMRGDIVVCVPPGEHGKARPAVVLQADVFLGARSSATVGLIASTPVDAPLSRVAIEPGDESGLRVDSRAMADKVMTLSRPEAATAAGGVTPIGNGTR